MFKIIGINLMIVMFLKLMKIKLFPSYVLFYKKRNTLYSKIEELYQKAYEEIDFKKQNNKYKFFLFVFN